MWLKWLEANVAARPAPVLAEEAPAPWFTVVFDREGYSPAWFEELWDKRIAILTYHKYSGESWPEEGFAAHSVALSGGGTVTLQLT